MTLMMQVGPHDAATNVCGYLPIWHECLKSLPPWFDSWAWLFPVALLCLCVFGLVIWPFIKFDPLQATKAKLSLDGPSLFQDKDGQQNRWRIRVINAGPASARNIHVRLVSVDPRPKYGPWSGDYPYPVPPLGLTIDAPERSINPGDSETFELFMGWKSASGEFYSSLDTRLSGHNPIRIEKDERWKLTYEITAENAELIAFSSMMFVEDDNVVLR